MTIEEIQREARCLYYEAIDQGEHSWNYESFEDAFDSMIENLYDTFDHEDAVAIANRAWDIRDENGRGED